VTDRVQVVAIAVSVVLLMVVLELVRRRKLVEEYSLLWILGSLAILGLSIWRGLLDIAARELGVFYPPSLLLMLLVVSVFVALLWFSVVLSRQRQQIDRLVEETAILGAEIRDLRAKDANAAPDGLTSP
jgi:NO-binding membrane sensor protein with MHYT domain